MKHWLFIVDGEIVESVGTPDDGTEADARARTDLVPDRVVDSGWPHTGRPNRRGRGRICCDWRVVGDVVIYEPDRMSHHMGFIETKARACRATSQQSTRFTGSLDEARTIFYRMVQEQAVKEALEGLSFYDPDSIRSDPKLAMYRSATVEKSILPNWLKRLGD